MPTAAELRALADRLERMEGLADAAKAAKAAYAADPGPETKTAHRAAAQALNDARDEVRASGVAAVATAPGSTTVIPTTVKGGGS